MKRIAEPKNEVVHFLGANNCTLCGKNCFTKSGDLFTFNVVRWPDSTCAVTCPDCAKLYCEIKNAPWHEVADAAMEHGMFVCGDSVWCGACGNAGCEMRGADRIVKCESFIREGAVQ